MIRFVSIAIIIIIIVWFAFGCSNDLGQRLYTITNWMQQIFTHKKVVTADATDGSHPSKRLNKVLATTIKTTADGCPTGHSYIDGERRLSTVYQVFDETNCQEIPTQCDEQFSCGSANYGAYSIADDYSCNNETQTGNCVCTKDSRIHTFVKGKFSCVQLGFTSDITAKFIARMQFINGSWARTFESFSGDYYKLYSVSWQMVPDINPENYQGSIPYVVEYSDEENCANFKQIELPNDSAGNPQQFQTNRIDERSDIEEIPVSADPSNTPFKFYCMRFKVAAQDVNRFGGSWKRGQGPRFVGKKV